MQTIKFADMLYNSASKKGLGPAYSPLATVGKSCMPTTKIFSAKAGNTKPMKISNLTWALDALFNSRISVIVGPGLIFAEYSHTDGKIESIVFDGKRFCCTGQPSKQAMGSAWLFYAMAHEEATFPITKIGFDSIANSFAKLYAVDTTLVAMFCTDFYYEAKEGGANEFEIEDLTDYVRREIEQGCRTGACQYYTGIGGEFMPQTFSTINVNMGAPSKTATPRVSTWYDEIKEGCASIDFPWSEDEKQRITPLEFLEDYIPCEAFRPTVEMLQERLTAAAEAIQSNLQEYKRLKEGHRPYPMWMRGGKRPFDMILIGAPGTGKTTFADALSAALNIPRYTVAIHNEYEETGFSGETRMVDGKLSFCETPFLKAFKNGGIVVLEEFNTGRPGVIHSISQAIESPYVLLENGVNEVYRHPLLVVIGTMNPGAQGTQDPNEAFTSRLAWTPELAVPPEEEAIAILQKATGAQKENAEKVFKCFVAFQDYLCNEVQSPEIATAITMRHCMRALEVMEGIGMPFKDAIKNTMVGTVTLRNAEYGADLVKHVLEAKKF